MNTTLVSAFLCISRTTVSPLTYYLKHIENFLQQPFPKILYLESHLLDQFTKYVDAQTIIIPIQFKDLYLYKFINQVDCSQIQDIANRDKFAYFCIQNNKTEWLRESIHLNPFESTQFVWVDVDVFHVLSEDKSLSKLIGHSFEKVRLPGICNISQVPRNVYRTMNQYFLGYVIGGNAFILLQWADECKKKCLEIIVEHKTLIWEVNVWYLVSKENIHLLDIYYSNINDSLINNYSIEKQDSKLEIIPRDKKISSNTKCTSILQCGICPNVFMWLFLVGLLKNVNELKQLTIVNLDNHPNIEHVKQVLSNGSIGFEFWKGNDLEYPDNEHFDIVFIETSRVYENLKEKLTKFCSIAQKYIIVHDITVDAEKDEYVLCNFNIVQKSKNNGYDIREIVIGLWSTIIEFVESNNKWKIKQNFTNYNGLIILEKFSE